MSTTPAFSPIPASILPIGVSCGTSKNCRRCTLEDLYEQCSDHMTEYIASSDEVGRRSRISLIRAYSPSFSPSSAHGCDWSGVWVALATVSATAATLPVFSHQAANRPIVTFGPVEEEPTQRHSDLRRHREPDEDSTVVQQGAQDGDNKRGNDGAARGRELRRDAREHVLEDRDP